MAEETKDKEMLPFLEFVNMVLAKRYPIQQGTLDDCKEYGFGYSYDADGTNFYGIFRVIPINGFIWQEKVNISTARIARRVYHRDTKKWSEWNIGG